jgi:hypothetical protein
LSGWAAEAAVVAVVAVVAAAVRGCRQWQWRNVGSGEHCLHSALLRT